MNLQIQKIFEQFNTGESFQDARVYGRGHINDTYLVITEGDHKPNYILQKINHRIFQDVPKLMENIRIVTDYIRIKNSSNSSSKQDIAGLTLVETKEKGTFISDSVGNYWRCFHFIENTIIYERITKPEIAHEAGIAIGTFQSMLADLEFTLHETLPGFHSFKRRYDEYIGALGNDPKNRKSQLASEIQFVEARIEEMYSYFNTFKAEGIPLRVTHNDTKVNNIIFNERNEAICLIDLDTVMPGYIHFDYGDALRTLANTAEEDEGQLDRINFDITLFEAFTEGYLKITDSFLTIPEKNLLAFAPRYLTFLIALRFLTDYLNGDIYFKVEEPEHNLRRTRAQFKLLSSIEDQYADITYILSNFKR